MPKPPKGEALNFLVDAGSPRKGRNFVLSDKLSAELNRRVRYTTELTPDEYEIARKLLSAAVRDVAIGKIIIDLKPDKVWMLDFSARRDQPVEIEVACKGVTISGAKKLSRIEFINHSEYGMVEVRKSDVRQFFVRENSHLKLEIEEAHIGFLSLAANSVTDFRVRGGSILNMSIPNPHAGLPFTGSVSFQSVFFPKNTKVYGLSGAQPYRNMRAHLASLQNGPGVSLFHSLEMAVEREELSYFDAMVSWFYGFSSNYGASAGRSLLILLGVWAASILLLCAVDGAVIANGACDDPRGIQQAVCSPEVAGSLSRSAILSLQPLTLFGNLLGVGRSVTIVASNWWVQIFLVFEGLVATTLLALSVFALRRKFRLSA
ncbi:hypothetical protein [Tepidicaulis marinus]|uniref:hypothetical protein n=1 Tax=Tepidicaulis marinus TaxID=1333998 RepID=UPI0005EEC989|nr:hypothetical protein [Tepidicaulis marinus]